MDQAKAAVTQARGSQELSSALQKQQETEHQRVSQELKGRVDAAESALRAAQADTAARERETQDWATQAKAWVATLESDMAEEAAEMSRLQQQAQVDAADYRDGSGEGSPQRRARTTCVRACRGGNES